MKKYQVKIWSKIELKWDWISVYANSSEGSLQHIKEKYSDYEISDIYCIERDYTLSPSYDTISLSNAREDEPMAFFNVNWNDYTTELSKLAAPETWSNDTYPNNGILANYIAKTYEKLQAERNIIFSQDYALFNTGLFTKYYEPIYAYQSGKNILFLTDYELGNIDIKERPERANYFEHPELLLFDWHCPINIQYSHILDDDKNRKRIPDDILARKDIINTLNGSIDTMKKQLSCNYKLAIPQYFEGKIQLLLPLCLKTDNIPDIALTVTKKMDIIRAIHALHLIRHIIMQD